MAGPLILVEENQCPRFEGFTPNNVTPPTPPTSNFQTASKRTKLFIPSAARKVFLPWAQLAYLTLLMSCIPSTPVCAEGSDRRHSLDMHLPCKQSEHFQDGRLLSHFNDTSIEENRINFLMNSSQRQSENPVSVKPKPKRKSRHNKRRRKSSSESRNRSRGKYRHPGIPFKACTTVTDWVHLTKSEDIWGDTVNISSHISVGGTTVGQYFYESYCEHEGSPCTGIKTEEYNSSCTTIHIWTYAHVFKNGEEGWNFIKIKGGCNCHLRRIIPPSGIFSIFDLN